MNCHKSSCKKIENESCKYFSNIILFICPMMSLSLLIYYKYLRYMSTADPKKGLFCPQPLTTIQIFIRPYRSIKLRNGSATLVALLVNYSKLKLN